LTDIAPIKLRNDISIVAFIDYGLIRKVVQDIRTIIYTPIIPNQTSIGAGYEYNIVLIGMNIGARKVGKPRIVTPFSHLNE